MHTSYYTMLFKAVACIVLVTGCCSSIPVDSVGSQPVSYNEIAEKFIGGQMMNLAKKIKDLTSTSSNKTKHGRFFTFNTGGGNNLEVELSFTVPFIDVPLQLFGSGVQSMMGNGSAGNGVSNVPTLNLPAVVVAAAMAMTAVFIVPKIFQAVGGMPEVTYGRESTLNKFLSRVDDALTTYNINPSSCLHRGVCLLVQSTSGRVNTGHATGLDKIVDGLTSMYVTDLMLSRTGIKEAIDIAKLGGDCSRVYSKCPLGKEAVYLAAQRIMSGKS